MPDYQILRKGERIMLRRHTVDDIETHIRWFSTGEWRYFNSPWSGYRTETSSEQAEKDRRFLLKKFKDPKHWLNTGAMIVTLAGFPIGDISVYGQSKFEHAWSVGIGICEDAYLNKGYGTEAMCLWVDYLFCTNDIHKLYLATWSFNPRMIRSADKVGFTCEGRERELREWQGEWLDLLHFGILREEWEKLYHDK